MKKRLSVLSLMLVLVLSGCGAKSDYDQMVKDLGQIKAMNYGMAEVGATVKGVDLNYTMEFDSKTPLFHGNIMGMDVYLDSENAYLKMLGNWFQTPLTDEVKADFEENFNPVFWTMDMPKGDEVISISSGVDKIDQTVNDKTYDDVVVATETGYTIIGLEEYVEIETADSQLTIKFVDGDNNIHLSLGKTEAFELPEEAKEGKVLPSDMLEAI